MKLISLSIQNFGKFHHYDLEPEDGLNVLCKENGWGKTTLAAFLKAMFYGLPKSKKTTIDENDFKHYEPWQGGSFGGNLVFSCKKGTFRVERTFGDDASFALYDTVTGLPSTVFTEDLGVELFGIDAEGFEQSAFLSFRALNAEDGNDSVRAKLTGIDEIHDISNFENAYDLLDGRAKEYKKRGGAGYIGETEAKINKLKDDLADARAKAKQGESADDELFAVRGEIAEKKAEAEKLQEKLLRAKQVAEIRTSAAKLDEWKREKAALENRFAGDLPTREELAECRRWIERAEMDRSSLASSGLDRTEQDELVALSSRFSSGAPSAEALGEKLAFAASLHAEQTNLRQALQTAQNDLRNAESRLAGLSGSRTLESDQKSRRFPVALFVAWILLLPAGAVALIFGVLQSILPLLIGGAIALGTGAFCLIFSLFVTLRQKRAEKDEFSRVATLLEAQKKDAESARVIALSRCEELTKAQQKCQRDAENLRVYLASFEIADADPVAGLMSLQRLALKWETLLEKQKSTRQSEVQKKEAIATLAAEISKFLSRCTDLSGTSEAERLATMEQLIADRETLTRLIAEREKELLEKLAALGIADASLLEREPDVASVLSAQKELETALEELAKKEAGLSARMERRLMDTERIPEWEEELSRQTELLAEQKRRYDLLCKTRDLLQKAHEDLTTRYLEPTRRHFEKYLALLSGKDVPKATLDAKFRVSVLDEGKTRQVDSYSRGWRDLLRFCVRLSLIDALYTEGEETPFLLLDDPFTNLDEERLAAAKALLEELAKSRQILYLVCHGDRA